MATAAELKLIEDAVIELKLTTAGWRKPNGNANYPSGVAPANSHWGKALGKLAQIDVDAPPSSPIYPSRTRYPSEARD